MKESVCKVLIRSKFVCGGGTELNAFIRFDKPRRRMGERGNEVVVFGGA